MDNFMSKIGNSICKNNKKYFDFIIFINYLFILMDLLDNSFYS